MNKVILVGLAIVIVLAMAGGLLLRRSSSGTVTTVATSPVTSGAVATDAVSISDYAFQPSVITVKVGTKVIWTNHDAVSHSVTMDQGGAPVSKLFGRDETYSYAFDKSGTYNYYCMPHPYMKGTVVVTD